MLYDSMACCCATSRTVYERPNFLLLSGKTFQDYNSVWAARKTWNIKKF
jgi:hypothetical protein